MFKLVVLCAFLAAATATPGALIAPLAYSANYVAPAPAIISQPSSLVYSSPAIATAPLAYSSPYGFAHLIKKRSLALGSYIAPSTYVASTPYVSTYTTPLATSYAAPLAASYAAPLATTYSAPIYSTAHLIKKRAAIFAPSTYVAPVSYAASPYLASTYTAAAPIVSTPLISSAAYVPTYSHLIKKRDVPVLAYSAPTSFSHQSRFDFQATSPAITTYSSYAAPLAYPAHFGVSHLI